MPSRDPLRQSFAALVGEQLRIVALAISREAILAGAALALICVLSVVMALKYNERLDLVPEMLEPGWIVALLLPFAVWKSDPVFGRAFLWTLPVRRQRAAIAKVIAGGVWLLAGLLVALVSLAIVVWISGGGVGITETRLIDSGAGTAAAAAHFTWSTPIWMWATPFTGALLFYLAGSAWFLGLRHPIRWAAGLSVGMLTLGMVLSAIADDGIVEQSLQWLRDTIWRGSAGLDFALSGGGQAYQVDRPGPGHDTLWQALPDLGHWAWATSVWLGLALLAMALAIRRHWER